MPNKMKTKQSDNSFKACYARSLGATGADRTPCSHPMFAPLISATDGTAYFRNVTVRGSMPNKPERMGGAQESIVVRAPIGSVYRQWLRIEDVPQFMPAVKNVQKVDGGHFAIVASLNGKRHEGVLEIMLRAPERRLAWRALAGRPSNYLASGVVSLTSRSDRSTC